LPYRIELSDSALEDMESLQKYERVLVLDSVRRSLSHEPSTETRNRKPLRLNPLAGWELRIDRFRVFYDVDTESQVVLIKAVGWKDHNVLLIRGKEHRL
jgi:mRNA-degrading endonuclease RelE of RelBE toxin-antitoxin system